jgi:aminoglycoside phosphotransferase (APT) family kinase protein
MTDDVPLDDEEVRALLVRAGVAAASEPLRCEPLAGGVSSDIRRVDLPGRSLCVKRALARLKVAADWRAPIERSVYEAGWLEVAHRLCPAHVPRPLGFDRATGTLVLPWLDPASHPVWKFELRDGRVEPAVAATLGGALAAIHRGTADDPAIASRFDTGSLFHALRIEPYLLATAQRHIALSSRLHAIARITADTRRALVHGDVSPKNVLLGPGGPLLIDAECAWYGDPAFDLAFVLNHLLLKSVWRPAHADALRAAFLTLAKGYLDGVDWEARATLDARAAQLLAGLLLARIDGKSPVEYLDTEALREPVRRVARALLHAPPDSLAALRATWDAAMPSSPSA